MKNIEKQFLTKIGYEPKTLTELQRELQWEIREVQHMAYDLTNEGVVRSEKIYYDDGSYDLAICKPIDRRSWRDKYWLVIAICSYLLGILSFVVKDYIGSLLK